MQTVITITRKPRNWLPDGQTYTFPIGEVMELKHHATAYARVVAKRHLRATNQPVTYDNIYHYLFTNPVIVEE